MKSILLTFFISFNVFAGNWIGVSEISSDTDGLTFYRKKGKCEIAKAEPCVNIQGVNLATHDYTPVQEDDLSSPIFAPESNVSSCSNRSECYALIADGLYCDGEPAGSFALVAGDYSRVYCTRITGYNQRIVNRFVEDPVKKQAFDDSLAQKAADEIAKAALRTPRRNILKQCVQELDGQSTQAQQSICIKNLIKDYGETIKLLNRNELEN